MFPHEKENDRVTGIKLLIHALIFGSIMVLLSGCTHQIELGELSEKCDKKSPVEQAKSPAFAAAAFYKEYYGSDDDEDCLTAKKQVGLSTDSKPYSDVKNLIGTRQCYHDAVLAYQTWETKHSLYLLGIEKPRNNSDKPYQLASNDITLAAVNFAPTSFASPDPADEDAVSDTQTYIKKVLNDNRSMVLTHILKVKSASTDPNTANRNECFVYNIYADNAPGKDTLPWCANRQSTQPSQSNTKWTQDGWKALEQLGKEIREEIDQKIRDNNAPTHIIMLATGWNTREKESLLDFQKWMDELQNNYKKTGERFNPIFIGFASELEWPGKGKPSWSSMVNKGRDADELGFTWANYLLNSVLKPISKETGIQLVGIGHSFGSRVILGSHYTRSILVRRSLVAEDVPVTLIGMQAAFPTGRFSSTRGSDVFYLWALPPGLYKNHPYLNANTGTATVVITTSTSDAANGVMTSGWRMTGFIGGRGGLSEFDNYRDDYKSVIRKISADKNGQPLEQPNLGFVSLYDASSFVCCELPGTESGSHSDVYDEEMGNFLGQIIRNGSTR